MLSIISSIYDPLGLASTFFLEGRQLLQSLCNQHVLWNDVVGPELSKDWERWEQKLKGAEDIRISRCIKPRMFRKTVETSLHHLSDASEKGYGQCSYIRLVNDEGKIRCTLLVGKSIVTPRKFLSTPRLELTAAVLSVKIACFIRKELNLGNITERFLTDSQVVLAYIRSNTKIFKVFVANRVQKIQEHSYLNQWNYVKGTDNPADHASRGLDPRKETSSSRWFAGPAFLWQRGELWPSYNVVTCVGDDDPEIKRDMKINAVQLENVLENVEKRVSDWCKLKRIIALVLIYLIRLLLKVRRKKSMVQMTENYDIVSGTRSFPDLNPIQVAESLIIKHLRESISQMSCRFWERKNFQQEE